MLRSFGLTFVFALVWINSTTTMALSQLPLEQTFIAQDYGTENDLPFCYMQTNTGELMDLTRFCGNGIRRQQTASTPASQSTIAPTPAIVVPSSPVPRGSACFVFDEQGRPCVSSR
jgi:hypothetical protein